MSSAVLEPQAAVAEAAAEHSDERSTQVVSFRLANEEYAVDIMRVQEIILIGQITEVPNVPEYVRGLINLRGHVIPVVDLRVRFRLGVADATEDTRIIVLNLSSKTVGVIVDGVDEVLRFSDDQVEPVSGGFTGVGSEYVRGLVKLENKLLILLNMDEVLRGEEVVQSASA